MANIILHDESGYSYDKASHIERISPFDVYRATSFDDVNTLVEIDAFRALLTEPIAHKKPTSLDGHMQKEYKYFLENTRLVKKIPVIIYTKLSEVDASREFGLNTTGLMEGIHYDRLVSQINPKADIQLIQFLRELKKYTNY